MFRVVPILLIAASPAVAQSANGTDPETTRVTEMARADAGVPGTSGWLGRGFLGGLVGGPFGLGYVVSRANQSAQTDAAAATDTRVLPGGYADLYRQAYPSRLLARRSTAALLGGVAGTGVLVFAIVQVVRLSHNTDIAAPEDGASVIRIPLLQWRH